MKWFKRIFLTLFGLEMIYLTVFNGALNLPLTQTLINNIKPEKFHITWDSGWTLFPFRVNMKNVSVNGETSSRQWQADLKSISASISLLPLLQHKVKVYDATANDVSYLQRSKMKQDKDISRISAYFPPIEGRKFEKVAFQENKAKETKNKKPQKKKKAWHIDVLNAVIHGHHTVWINHIKGDLNGDLEADVTVETRGGPFSIENARADILINKLLIDDNKMVLEESKINGTYAISPVVYKENKGKNILKFISFNIDIDAKMGNFDFLDIYLKNLKNLKEMMLDGEGLLQGHINFHKGIVLPKTAFKIDANKLSLEMFEHVVKGEGQIELDVTDKKSDEVNMKILFNELQAYFNADTSSEDHNTTEKSVALFRGKGLVVNVKAKPSLFPQGLKKDTFHSLTMEIPSVKVEDLSQFQRYIPQKWRFKLYDGEGKFQAKVTLLPKRLRSKLQLDSKGAHIGVNKHRFQSDLDLLLNLDFNTSKELQANVSGSYISLTNSILSKEKKSDLQNSKQWNTKLTIDEGTLNLALLEESNGTLKLSKEEKIAKIKELISDADAKLVVSGSVSRLEWINLLLKNSLDFSLSGHGNIESKLALEKGFLSKGSMVKMHSKELEVSLLDYRFNGDGVFSFDVTKGGEQPDVKFSLGLNEAQMKRRNEKLAMIDNVVLKLDGVANNLDFEGVKNDIELHLQIPSARVKKVSVYNQFFPKNSPFKFLNGSADLRADIQLRSNDAKGYVSFKTDKFTMEVDEQKIEARLDAKIKLVGGVPRNMDFDISGSSIVLDHVKVTGDQTNYDQEDWSAIITLKKADAIWKRPVRLKSETMLKIKDSRPIVAMIDNKREKSGLLSKLLTVKDIEGTAKVNMANNIITIPSAFLKSDKIDLGAKGIISPNLRDAVFFLRYKKLKGLLKINNGKKNFDIFGVQKTFDNYVIPR